MNQKTSLEKTNSNRQAFRGKEAKYPQVETELLEYVSKTRAQGFVVSVGMLQLEARKVASKQNILSTEFKASYGWVRRFMQRHDLAIRRRTSMAQRLPETYQEKLLEFQKHVITLQKKNDYNLAAIGNADETPVFFDMPGDDSISQDVTGQEI